MKNKLLLFSLAALTSTALFGQLNITAEPNDTAFIFSLAGPGVTVSGIERNCGSDASGFFNSADANVGIENGIVLTSGSAAATAGPNDISSESTYVGSPGDTDLDALTMWTTYDACIIEFDMTVMADTVKLNYVFGSDEYPEFVMGGFNDVFAFWVSGPGIATPINIATVPDTDLPVSINNINAGIYSDYYVSNGTGFDSPYDVDDYYIQYDGMTTVLQAKLAVTAGETYHMKMAIADASDGVYDSGVFLETGSLGSLRMHTDIFADNDLTYAVEKCANGYFTFTNEVPSTEPLVLDYYIEGSAINGVDYETITEQVTIPAGMSSTTLEIIPIHDIIDESFESVVLYLYNPQSGVVYDTLTMLIDDEPASASFTSEVTDLTVQFAETSGIAASQEWDFGDGSFSTEAAPLHTYAAPGVYNVCVSIVNNYGCSDTDCKMVTVGNVGIEEELIMLVVQPNPAKDMININGISTNASITIIDMQGKTVYNETTSSNSGIDISPLAPGIYTIYVNDNGSNGSSKFTKM